jgi:hypothetical protein
VKYDRAWWAKLRALKLIYGDWAEMYEHLPAMLHAMNSKNTGMDFEMSQNLKLSGQRGDSISSTHSGHLDSA